MTNLDLFSKEIIANAVVVGLANNGLPVYQSSGVAPETFKKEGFGNAGVNFFKAVPDCPGLFHRWYANGFLNGPRNYEFYIMF